MHPLGEGWQPIGKQEHCWPGAGHPSGAQHKVFGYSSGEQICGLETPP
jgi:hypothetical protein